MARPMFTPEELEELRRFDENLDDSFVQTQEEIRESRKRDREAKLLAMEPEKRKIAEYQAAYYEANREKFAEYKAAYYEANREKIAEYQAAYYEANREKFAERNAAYYEANREKIAERNAAYRDANREKYNAYMREYMRKRRAAKKLAALASANDRGNLIPSVSEADSSPLM